MSTSLKVLSLNIHKGFNWTNQSFVLESLRTVIRQENADIVFLQEVVGENLFHRSQTQNWPSETQFEFLADEVWSHYSYGKNAVYDDGHHGNAILSKHPIVYEHNLDISTNKLEQRGLLHCKVKIDDKSQELDLLCTHFNIFHNKKYQSEATINYINAQIPSHNPIILAGDFNDWNSKVRNSIQQQLSLSPAIAKSVKTFPVVFPIFQLDCIYFKNLKLLSGKTFAPKNFDHWSDHLGVKANLHLQL